MSLPITALTDLINCICNPMADKEAINQANQTLTQWYENLGDIPTALEIIQKPNTANILTFALLKISSHYKIYESFLVQSTKSIEEHQISEDLLLSNDQISIIYDSLINRILANRNNPVLQSKTYSLFFDLIATSIYLYPPLYESLSKLQLSLDELLFFFSSLLKEISIQKGRTILPADQKQLDNVIHESAPKLFDLLRITASNGKLTPQWTTLHCYMYYYVDCFTELSEFLPYVQDFLQDPESIPILLDFYELILSTEKSDDFPYLMKIIEIMVNYTKSFFPDPSENQLDIASFIWNKTIDLTFDFYGTEVVGSNFSFYVFQNFLEILNGFLICDTRGDFKEYFELLNIYSCCLSYQSTEISVENMFYFVSMGLDFIINQLNFVASLTLPRDDHLYPYCLYQPSMDEYISSMTRKSLEKNSDYSDDDDDDDDDEKDLEYRMTVKYEVDKDFCVLLSKYFNEKIDNLSEGLIYVLSLSPTQTTKNFYSRLGPLIFDMPVKPISAIYFIANYCSKNPEIKLKEIEMAFQISQVQFAPAYEVMIAMKELTKFYPDVFVMNQVYVQILLQMTASSPPNDLLSNSFISFFNVLHLIAITATTNPTFVEVRDDLFEKVHHVWDEKMNQIWDCRTPIENEIELMNQLNPFISIVLPILRESPNNQSILTSLYSALFVFIQERISPLFGSMDVEIQMAICDPIVSALAHNWITNKEIYFHWVEQAIFNCLVPEHIEILSYLTEFLPSQPIHDFLASFANFKNEKIISKVIHFFRRVIENCPTVLAELIDLNTILLPLNSNINDVYERELSMLIRLVKSPPITIPPETVNLIIQTTVKKTFENMFFNRSLSLYSLAAFLLWFIGKRYKISDQILRFILDTVATKSVGQFPSAFMQDNEDDLKKGIFDLWESLANSD